MEASLETEPVLSGQVPVSTGTGLVLGSMIQWVLISLSLSCVNHMSPCYTVQACRSSNMVIWNCPFCLLQSIFSYFCATPMCCNLWPRFLCSHESILLWGWLCKLMFLWEDLCWKLPFCHLAGVTQWFWSLLKLHVHHLFLYLDVHSLETAKAKKIGARWFVFVKFLLQLLSIIFGGK